VLGPLRAARRKLVPAAAGGAAVGEALDDDVTDREVRSRS